MTPFTNTAERQRIAALDADVRKLDTALATFTDRLDGARARRDALTARIAGESAVPTAPDAATDDLAARLAADPATAIDASTTAQLRDSRAAAAVRDHGAAGVQAAFHQALTAVEGEIAGLEADIAAGQVDRAHAWEAFVRGAYDGLAAELLTRWEVLTREVLTPMQELSLLRLADGPGGIVNGLQRRIAPESSLSLVGPGNERVYLLVAERGGGGVRDRHPEAVDALRAALAL